MEMDRFLLRNGTYIYSEFLVSVETPLVSFGYEFVILCSTILKAPQNFSLRLI